VSVLIRASSAFVLSPIRASLAFVLIAACSSAGPAPTAPPQPSEPTSASYPADGVAASGYAPDGSLVLLSIRRDKIDSVTEGASKTTWVWPPIVDSHVHLALFPVGAQLAAHGIGAVVDLAAPERDLPALLGPDAPLDVIASGPMLTSPNGYPLDSWGADGYGIGCADSPCITAAIDRLAAAGAKVIKLPLDPGGLAPALVKPSVAYAHVKGLRVAVHALSADAAKRGAAAGADLLAHTPAEPLDAATIEAWRGRAVISTLAAFGAPAAVENLKKLRAAGVIVLYGTDLGNLRAEGPAPEEVALLRKAGLDDAAIVDAMTTAPVAYWKLPMALREGDEATLLVLEKDPRTDASALLAPRTVIHRGRVVR